ncbi:MAG: hypothetical protein GY898_33080 [Proteobacteria bacterium]|nr:hypothetical protein [Pseudomonadota bacterium]
MARFLLLLLLLPLTACGPVPADDDDAGDDDDDTPYVATGPWADLSFTERIAYMENIVEPAMQELFLEFDPVEFEDFGCETCHGEDADDVEYELPNGVTPISFPLDVSEPGREEFADFMDEVVKPEMAALVDEQPFPQGDFGCFACHERE